MLSLPFWASEEIRFPGFVAGLFPRLCLSLYFRRFACLPSNKSLLYRCRLRAYRGWSGGEKYETAENVTALLTADLAAAEGWYTKLLGRGPDYRPMGTLVQWELFDQGGLMVDEIAGSGVMFLYVQTKNVSPAVAVDWEPT